MRFRDWFGHPESDPAEPPAETLAQEHRDLFRQAADLLAAGDAAIDRALSTDSEVFLSANRQEGGE